MLAPDRRDVLTHTATCSPCQVIENIPHLAIWKPTCAVTLGGHSWNHFQNVCLLLVWKLFSFYITLSNGIINACLHQHFFFHSVFLLISKAFPSTPVHQLEWAEQKDKEDLMVSPETEAFSPHPPPPQQHTENTLLTVVTWNSPTCHLFRSEGTAILPSIFQILQILSGSSGRAVTASSTVSVCTV